jgi:glycosyltransferase involved in cell wall biosynthesis
MDAALKAELVFVDNASTDGCGEFVQSLWDELGSNIELQVLREERAGLVFARECGVRAARGKYIIFCDDDNWLREDYLQTAYNLMQQMPNVGVLGGQSVLSPGVEAPEWWEEQQGNFAVGKQLPQSGNANERGFLYGAGMVTRTELARRVFDDRYPFLLTGRKGTECLSGEDSEYCMRTMLLGYDLYYSETLFYWHDVDPKRLTREQLNKLLHSFEIGGKVLVKYLYAVSFNRRSKWDNFMLLIKRMLACVFVQPKYRPRKRELLYMQAFMCGLIKNDDTPWVIIRDFARNA